MCVARVCVCVCVSRCGPQVDLQRHFAHEDDENDDDDEDDEDDADEADLPDDATGLDVIRLFDFFNGFAKTALSAAAFPLVHCLQQLANKGLLVVVSIAVSHHSLKSLLATKASCVRVCG